ncbi:exported hypothetical protein [Arthrobacter sp. 9AX]|nr:exported hypothetical protein [Arthrobacter sp. 9AX]
MAMAASFLTVLAFAAASAALAVVVALPEVNREDVLGIVVISILTLIGAVTLLALRSGCGMAGSMSADGSEGRCHGQSSAIRRSPLAACVGCPRRQRRPNRLRADRPGHEAAGRPRRLQGTEAQPGPRCPAGVRARGTECCRRIGGP